MPNVLRVQDYGNLNVMARRSDPHGGEAGGEGTGANQREPSETSMAYEIFGPLWSLLDIAAVRAWRGTSSFAQTLACYVHERWDLKNQVADSIRDSFSFGASTMAIFEEQGGWGAEALAKTSGQLWRSTEQVADCLVLYCHEIEPYPLDLSDKAATDRALASATDVQSIALWEGLGWAARVRVPDPAAAASCVNILDLVSDLVALERGTAPFAWRAWRATSLSAALRHDSMLDQREQNRLREMNRECARIFADRAVLPPATG